MGGGAVSRANRYSPDEVRRLWDDASRLRVDLEMTGVAFRDLGPEPLWCRLEGVAETEEEYERWKKKGNSAPPWAIKALSHSSYRELYKLRRKLAGLDDKDDPTELSEMSRKIVRQALAGLLEDMYLRPDSLSAEKKMRLLKDVQSFIMPQNPDGEDSDPEADGLPKTEVHDADLAMEQAGIPERFREAMRDVYQKQQLEELKKQGIAVLREENSKQRNSRGRR